MELNVRNAHGMLPSQVKEYAIKKIKKLERFINRIGDVEFVHETQKGRHTIQLSFEGDGLAIRGTGEANDLREAIDDAIDRVEERLKRVRGKLRERGNKHAAQVKEQVEINDEVDEPEVTQTRTYSMRPIALDDAMLNIELSGLDYYVFFNTDTERVNLLYRLKNGNYGLMEPDA